MLPAQARLRRRPEFAAAVRSGRRAGRATVVVHFLPNRAAVPGGGPVVSPGRARAGFVVGRTVGNSVVRHRVVRQLRHLMLAELHRLPSAADIVVRARPEAAKAGSAALRADLDRALTRVLGDRAVRS